MAEKIIVSCPYCSTKMSVPADYSGLEGHCPKCQRAFVMNPAATAPVTVPRAPAAQPPAIPASAAAPGASVKSQNMSVAGWICFAVGMVLLVLCPIIPFYSPFFLVSFVLGIVLLVRDEGGSGLTLLLTTILMPAAVGAAIVILGVGAIMAAFSGFTKESEGKQHALMTQQTAAQKQFSGQQAPFSQPSAPRPAPSRPIFLQPPTAPVQQPAVALQPPVAQPLPAKEITFDGLLSLLNRYGIEFNSATTSLQKQDIRTRAQKEAIAFVENARVTLAGTVSDVKYGEGGSASLTVKKFDAPDYAKQSQKTLLSIPASGKIKVPLSREAALAIKSDQKVWITGRLQLTPTTSLAAGFGEAGNPSILMMKFSGDSDMLLTMRIRDYTVSFEDKRVQTAPAAPRVKKPYSLVVVPPNATP